MLQSKETRIDWFLAMYFWHKLTHSISIQQLCSCIISQKPKLNKIWYCSTTTSLFHACPCMVPQEIYNSSPLRVCVDHVLLWRGTYVHGSCNLPYVTRGIVRHGIATCLTVTQATCYGKYLTMPYCKDAMKQFFS